MFLKKRIKFLYNEGGSTAIEYGLIASIISIVILSSLGRVGGVIQQRFELIGSTLEPEVASSPTGGAYATTETIPLPKFP